MSDLIWIKLGSLPSADSGDGILVQEPRPVIQQSKNTATGISEPIVNPTASTVSPPIDSLAKNPARLSVFEGDDVHSSNNELEAPEMINLATSGLRRSQQSRV